MAHRNLLKLAHKIIMISISIMIAGIYIGFIDHDNWSLTAQVMAHVGTMLSAATLKLGYVMHLTASKHLSINEFAAA